MSDVLLRIAADGGDLEMINGQFTREDGFESMAGICLFGGNERDSGGDETLPLEWWGNKGEPIESRRLRSRTQHLLRSIPLTLANLRRLEAAALLDLAAFVDEGWADVVRVECSIPTVGWVRYAVEVETDGTSYAFEFLREALAS